MAVNIFLLSKIQLVEKAFTKDSLNNLRMKELLKKRAEIRQLDDKSR